MKKKIELKEQEKKLLFVLHFYSGGKNYMFLDQLGEIALRLNIFKNQNTFNKAIFQFRADNILETKSYRKNYKIVSLTHYAAYLIGFKMKKKEGVKPLTLELITKKNYYLLKLMESNSEYIENEDDFLEGLNSISSTILLTQNPRVCIDYYTNLDMKDIIKKKHIQYLENVEINLKNNLKGKPNENISLKEMDTILHLLKKNIFLCINSEEKMVVYEKFLIGGVEYNKKKILDETAVLDKFHNSVFPEHKYSYNIFANSNEDERYVLEEIDKIKNETFSATFWKDCIKVASMEAVLKYFYWDGHAPYRSNSRRRGGNL